MRLDRGGFVDSFLRKHAQPTKLKDSKQRSNWVNKLSFPSSLGLGLLCVAAMPTHDPLLESHLRAVERLLRLFHETPPTPLPSGLRLPWHPADERSLQQLLVRLRSLRQLADQLSAHAAEVCAFVSVDSRCRGLCVCVSVFCCSSFHCLCNTHSTLTRIALFSCL